MIIKIKQGYVKYRSVNKSKYRLFELERIFVSLEYRRKCYASKLFKRMESNIKGYRKLFLTTHASNKVAHKFYEKMGMKMEAILPDHYYDGVVEIVYSKKGEKNGK